MDGSRDTDDDFRSFVLEAQQRLLHLADALTGDRGRAEDLVQHGLLKTYLAWNRVRSGNPESFARAVIVNKNIDWWRRRPWRERPSASLPDVPAGVERASELARREIVIHALAQLTVRERTVIVLKYFYDLPDASIATELRCAVGTVKSTASRALDKLKENPELRKDAVK